MGATTLTWPEYQTKANRLKGSGLKPNQIKQRLGTPTWDGVDWHIQSDGKGGISRKKLSGRQEQHNRSGEKRTRLLRKSNEHLTEEQLKAAREKKRLINEEGLEADHTTEVKESGAMLDDLDKDLAQGKITQEQYDEAKAKIRAKPIGDDIENIKPLSPEDNTQKTQDIERVQKRLRDMEKENPSAREDWERWVSLYRNVNLFRNTAHYALKYGKPVLKTGADLLIKSYVAHSLMH
tara:strand:- start:2 stop:709 length:708 start_codon:yes stop_codon:yes gene_type:complete